MRGAQAHAAEKRSPWLRLLALFTELSYLVSVSSFDSDITPSSKRGGTQISKPAAGGDYVAEGNCILDGCGVGLQQSSQCRPAGVCRRHRASSPKLLAVIVTPAITKS